LVILAETSVNFTSKSSLSLSDCSKALRSLDIDLDRLNATEVTDSVDFDYNVTAFQCDDNGDVSNEVLTQGSDVYICVETTAPNVEIAEIRELTMTQGAFNTTPIVGGIEDPLTQVTIVDKEATIRYQIISQFFADPFPDDIVATGSVLLAFTDDSGSRFLRHAKVLPKVPSRELRVGFRQRRSGRGGFQLGNGGGVCQSSGIIGHACASMTSLIVLMIGGVIAKA
jgi:hypothetical protein